MPPSLTPSLILFFYLGLGVFCARTGLVTPDFNCGLARFLLKVTLPTMIFTSMLRPYVPGDGPRIIALVAVSFAVYGASILLAYVAGRWLGSDPDRKGVYRFGMVFSNVGFMGFPIMEAFFGETHVFYTSVYNIAFQILVFTAGLMLLGWSHCKTAKSRAALLLNPNIVSALLGMAFFFLGWRLPAPLPEALGRLGELTTPLSMVFIGATLAKTPSFQGLWDLRILAVSLYRVILAPIAIYLALRPLTAWGFPIEVPVMIASMPVAANAAILAEGAGGDVEAASRLVTLSTALSLVTIPLMRQGLGF